MASTTPTHRIITHKKSGTVANVPVVDRISSLLDGGHDLSKGDRAHVAIAFKYTPPIEGPDLSDRHVYFSDLDIQPVGDPYDPNYGEPPVPMDHHGDPLVGYED